MDEGIPALKPVGWIGSSRVDLQGCPKPIRRAFGFALLEAQAGRTHSHAKPMKGFGGAGVWELAGAHRSGSYRMVYTVLFDEVVFVLHVFQKKSRRGIATPKHDLDLIRERLRQTWNIHANPREIT